MIKRKGGKERFTPLSFRATPNTRTPRTLCHPHHNQPASLGRAAARESDTLRQPTITKSPHPDAPHAVQNTGRLRAAPADRPRSAPHRAVADQHMAEAAPREIAGVLIRRRPLVADPRSAVSRRPREPLPRTALHEGGRKEARDGTE